MENQSSESLLTEGTFEGEAPGLAGIVGRMRLMVGDQASACWSSTTAA